MKSQRSKNKFGKEIHQSHINGNARGWRRTDLMLDRLIEKMQKEAEFHTIQNFRRCLECNRPLKRTIYPSGQMQSARIWKKRKFCSIKCAGTYNKRHKKGYWKPKHLIYL